MADCLDRLAWVEDVVVLDSFSTDATVRIARARGARIVRRAFDDFSTHKNWALRHIPFRHGWVLLVDADERITPRLASEIRRLLARGPDCAGYYVARQNMFSGRWIRHGGWFPDWNMRLLKRGCGRYERRRVHEHVILKGRAGHLRNPLIHQDFKGMERYFERHNTYSSLEAGEAFRMIRSHRRPSLLKASLFTEGPARRRFLKNLAYRWLPGRSLFKFLWMYLFRLGFLDGRAGFRFCLLHTFYEYQVSLKFEELMDPASPMSEKYRGWAA